MRGFGLVPVFVSGLGFVVGVVFAFTAQAATDQKASAFVLCKNQKNVRTIKILPSAEKVDNAAGCAVSYAKSGTDEVVGSNRSLDACKSILKSIQYNLETSKWSCRNVQTAVVTTSREATVQ
jgi:hypothetical protein